MRNCRVHHLQIYAPDALCARRVAFLVEDGLRTATLAGEASQLLIVRALATGRIGKQTSAAALGRQLEHSLQSRRMQAVHGSLAAAASADAVFFHDEVEARQVLALIAAHGETPMGWYWRHAVPEWRPGLSANETVRVALHSAAAMPAGTMAVASVMRGLLEVGTLTPLLEALQPDDGPALLASCGWPALPAPLHDSPPTRPVRRLPASSATLAACVQRWGGDDPRTLWLANMLAVVEQPARLADPALSHQSRQWIASIVADADVKSVAASTRPPSPVDGDTAEAIWPRTDATAVPAQQDSGWTTSEAQHASARAVGAGRLAREAPPRHWMGLPLHASGASGIWLLLAVLERLGLAAWLDAHGTAIDAGLPQRILSAICRQVGVVPDDAVWRELEVAAVDHALGTGADPAVEAMVTDWCMRVETWCVGTAGIDLGAIVLRRGWLHTTRTHVDIYFDLADVDVRTRRAGLDFDPGWVPWLGRVVTFFYEAGLAAIPL